MPSLPAAVAGCADSQCSPNPCRISSALPPVVACGGAASWPRVALGAAGGAAAHHYCYNRKETSPSSS